MEILPFVADFVELAHKYHNWYSILELEENEKNILINVLRLAGFEVKSIAFGPLFGEYRDQDGPTGEKFRINTFSNLKVLNEDNSDYYRATGWLSNALSKAKNGSKKYLDETIKGINEEILRSVPLEPIKISSEGDILIEYPPSTKDYSAYEYFIEHTRDSNYLNNCVGIHKFCGGWVDRISIAEEKDALICRNCHQRFIFPKEVKTYGDLRKFFSSKEEVILA